MYLQFVCLELEQECITNFITANILKKVSK